MERCQHCGAHINADGYDLTGHLTCVALGRLHEPWPPYRYRETATPSGAVRMALVTPCA